MLLLWKVQLRVRILEQYWDSFEEGIYVDITTGEPLFSSKINLDLSADGQVFLNQ